MKPLSLDIVFPEPDCDISKWQEIIVETGNLPTELMREEESLVVHAWYVLYLIKEGLEEKPSECLLVLIAINILVLYVVHGCILQTWHC